MNARWHWTVWPMIVLVSAGLVSCSSGSKPSSAPAAPATTPAAPATTPAAPATTPAAPATTPAAPGTTPASGDTLPDFKPSTVISHAGTTTVLSSPAAVDKIAAFYENALKSGGWQWKATAKSAYSAHYEATKGSARASIQVSRSGTGASISVTVTK